jgi:hypothetical protein
VFLMHIHALSRRLQDVQPSSVIMTYKLCTQVIQ